MKRWSERNKREWREWMIQLLKFFGFAALLIATVFFLGYFFGDSINDYTSVIITLVGLAVAYVKVFFQFLRDVRFFIISFVILIAIPATIYFFCEIDDLVHKASRAGMEYSVMSYEVVKKNDVVENELPYEPKEVKVADEGNVVKITVDGVMYKMVRVSGGKFRMGSNDGGDDEKPVHLVTLSDYYIGETEVTQWLWSAVMGSNPSENQGKMYPVENVSWNDCQAFVAKLNELTDRKFTLPTEAQWEFAAKGGVKSKGYKFSGSDAIDEVAWYWNKKSGKTHKVAQKQPNEIGLYDMSGNVYDICSDIYGAYGDKNDSDPKGAATGQFCVLRGGSSQNGAFDSRVECRHSDFMNSSKSKYGLRLVLNVSE